MKPVIQILTIILTLGIGAAALTANPVTTASQAGTDATAEQPQKTASFTVENMTCAMCPVTVRKAMEKVEGVSSVAVDFQSRTATVTYDPARATLEAIAVASGNAGYPARLKD